MPNQVYSYSSASHQNIIVLNCVKSFPRPVLCERHGKGKLASEKVMARELSKNGLLRTLSDLCRPTLARVLFTWWI